MLSETLIHPEPDEWRVYLRELTQSLDLVMLLTRRNIKLRYRQTAVGAAWAILQPILTMAVFAVLFGRLMKVPTGGVPYPAFALCALAPWSYFVHAVTITTRSLVDQNDLITKVYFPRLILPLSATLEATVDFLFSTIVLFVLLPFYGIWPGWPLLALPLFLAMLTMVALGAGLWLSALNLRYRDVMSAMPFAMQLLMFVSPVAYSSTLIPPEWRLAYAINPLSSILDGFRWALLGQAYGSRPALLISLFSGLALLISGVVFFRGREATFPDEV
jgi:lipopolysaccharide transport system permease protein